MRRIFISLFLLLNLAGCAAETIWASDDEVTRARYVAGGPPMISLFTVIGTSSGTGGHSGLMINGSERVLFDPAGSWYHPQIPERNDLHYGISNPAIAFYEDYHARVTWYVVRNDIVVSPEVAEKAIQLAKAYGAVPKAQCSASISSILRQLPGFEDVQSTMFPVALMKSFKKLPGVTESIYRDQDPDNNDYMVAPAL